MFPFNIVESQALELMKECTKKNIGFIAMKPVAGGNIENVPLGIKYCLNNEDCSRIFTDLDKTYGIEKIIDGIYNGYKSDDDYAKMTININ